MQTDLRSIRQRLRGGLGTVPRLSAVFVNSCRDSGSEALAGLGGGWLECGGVEGSLAAGLVGRSGGERTQKRKG